MANLLITVLLVYALVVFAVLIRSAVSKNKTAEKWYLALNIGSIVYLAVILFARNALVGDTDDLGTAVLSLLLVGTIFVLSVIGIIINLVKIHKYKPGKVVGDAVFVVIFLVLPIFIFGFARIDNDAQLKNADLVLVDKSYSGFVEASRTNIIVADGVCKKVGGKIALSDDWQWTTQVYWTVEPGGTVFKRDFGDSNLVLSEAQKTDMQTIFKKEIGDRNPSEYCGAIHPIEDTDYYITEIRKTTGDGCFGDNLGSHLYKHQQRLCDSSSGYSEIYYKK